jgi:hypothetical protein
LPQQHPRSAEIALNVTVRHAVSSLQQVPDVRTAVLLISPGPKRPLRITTTSLADRTGGDDADTDSIFLAGSVSGSALSEAGYATVPVYAISAWGLSPPGALDPVRRVDPLMQGIQVGNDYLHTVANLSGGRAFTDRNDVGAAARRILAELSSHYLIGYSPTYPVVDGRFRRLEVEVARQGAEVVPSGRLVRSPRPLPADFKPSARAALAGILPLDGFPLRLQTAANALALGINAPAPAEAASIECALFDPGGMREIALVRADAAITASGWQDVTLSIGPPPGIYAVRCGVHLTTTGRMASVYGDVTVRK